VSPPPSPAKGPSLDVLGLPPWSGDALGQIDALRARRDECVVAIDDDPTGCQTVGGVPAMLGWSPDTIAGELREGARLLFLMTNSRSMTPAAAVRVVRGAAQDASEASRRAGRPITLVSRSDSTLRGHFPVEMDGIQEGAGRPFRAWLLLPCFEEGGRLTVEGVHYLRQGERLVPIGETEFARDPTFGFRASDMREWVEEKSGGRWLARDVFELSLSDIRSGGPARVARRLAEVPPGSVGIVSAVGRADIEVFTAGLLAAESTGDRYLVRSAASFLPVRAGLPAAATVVPGDLELPHGGGLIVCGSYVESTTRQLAALFEGGAIEAAELDIEAVLAGREPEILPALARRIDDALGHGRDVAVYTSRMRSGATGDAALGVGSRVAGSLVRLVRAINVRPRYVLAKGGITSHQTAHEGLGAARVEVLGPLFAGVPVWRLGPDSRFPGLIYVVFPGNVGGDDGLLRAVKALGKAGC
jgi:uncharacterized protein YgbK (DUF1537 family)